MCYACAHGESTRLPSLDQCACFERDLAKQVEAISNLKIDKVTVWDSGAGSGRGSSTANFVSSLVRSIPPLQDIAAMAGVELPDYLGRMAEEKKDAEPTAEPSDG